MTHNVPVQSLIDHIKTALDVDPWAKEMAEELLKEQEPVEPWLSYDGNEYIFQCSNCDYEIYHNGDSRDEYKAKEYAIFCRHCGRKVKWE